MKNLLLLVLAAAAAWWYFVGGRKLSEEQVTDYYRQVEVATLQRKPDDLCALLAPEFQSAGTVAVAGQVVAQAQDRTQTCDAYRDLYATFEKLGAKMGGLLQLDSNYTVHSVSMSPDGKTATVDFSSSLDVGGSLMNLRSRSTDTLVRRNGKVLMLRSEGTGTLGNGH